MLLSLPTPQHAFHLLQGESVHSAPVGSLTFPRAGEPFPACFDRRVLVKITGFARAELADSRVPSYWGPDPNSDWGESCAPEWHDWLRYSLERSPALDIWPFGCFVRLFFHSLEIFWELTVTSSTQIFELLIREPVLVLRDEDFDDDSFTRAVLDASSSSSAPNAPHAAAIERFRRCGLTGSKYLPSLSRTPR